MKLAAETFEDDTTEDLGFIGWHVAGYRCVSCGYEEKLKDGEKDEK